MASAMTNLTSGSDTNAGATTTFNTASITPGANRLVLVAIMLGSGVTVSSVTGCGLTWAAAISPLTWDGTGKRLALWRSLGASPSTGALTITVSSSPSSILWSVDECTEVLTTGSNGADAVVQAVSEASVGSVTSHDVTLASFADAVNNVTYAAFSWNNDGNVAPAGSLAQLAEAQVTTPDGTLMTAWVLGEDTTPESTWPFAAVTAGGIAIEIEHDTGAPPPTGHGALLAGSRNRLVIA